MPFRTAYPQIKYKYIFYPQIAQISADFNAGCAGRVCLVGAAERVCA